MVDPGEEVAPEQEREDDPVSQFDLKLFRVRAAAGFLAALMLASSVAAEEPEDPGPLDPRLLDAVFVVEAGSTRGLGFLIDSSGLVTTDPLFVRDAEYAILDVDPQRRFVAQALVRGENSGVAVLRVNPEAVTGIKPLPLANRTVKRLRRGATIVAAAHQPDGTGLSLVRGVVSKIRSRFILHDARLTAMDFGGPLMNTDGVVVGVSRAGRVRSPDPSSATPVWLRAYLEQARDRAMELPLPSARALSAVAEGIQGPKDAVAAPSLDTDPADYRIRSGKRSLEFLTPRLLRALEQRADFRVIPGETPWGWVQHAGVRDPIVVVQVVPDLRWTGGSYFRVAGRLVSYPVMVVAQVFFLLIEALGGADHPLVLPAELWKPAHAAYHFKGDFLEARLLRDGVEVRPIKGQRHCGTSEVQMSRRSEQKPRSRKIRGCWGSYIYPAEAFAPGGALEIRLVEEGQEDRPEVVMLPRDLQEHLWTDIGPTSGGTEGRASAGRMP